MTSRILADAHLVLGPLLRYVDERRATIWVETDRACVVTVAAAGSRHTASTWSVHGHHYALVGLEELPEKAVIPYRVELDERAVWPEPGSSMPPSVIRTPDFDTPYRLAFGSCRRSDPLDADHLERLGADALVALANRMTVTPHEEWPDALLMIGDQVYADEPSEAILVRLREADRARHPDVRDEIQDFEEYTWLYEEAWTPTAVRWLLSTVPVGMLLDDHDLRDDWNTSLSWRREVTTTPWWRDRVIGAYGSYWVYQHLGNLSPEQLADDELYRTMLASTDDEERTRCLDDAAWHADRDPSSIRWSFRRDLGGAHRRVRLVAIDSRCSRHLDPDDRHLVDADEWAWVRDQVLPSDGYDHLVLASTLPFLLLPGIHHVEGWDEAISEGAWGRPGRWVGEKLRQILDLEHWAAWRQSFREMTDLLEAVAGGPDPPATILLLGGDVHCSYTAGATLTRVEHPSTAIHQLTMSPFRNDIEAVAKTTFRLLTRRGPTAAVHGLARVGKVADVDICWSIDHGVWFRPGLMTIVLDGADAMLDVDQAVAADGEQVLQRAVADLHLSPG
jgi:hypothetical protein